ncbi:MAG TPA: phage head closure protein [Rhizobiaceae bacterium]|nr:phage head closure protein [Rhizobiaceae bacterium]
MRAGNLDCVIVIESYVPGEPNEFNEIISSWEPLAEVRAQIIQASTEEFMRSWGISSETAIIFRTRYVPNVRLVDRIRYEGEVHNIKEVKELGRRRGLEIRTARSGL